MSYASCEHSSTEELRTGRETVCRLTQRVGRGCIALMSTTLPPQPPGASGANVGFRAVGFPRSAHLDPTAAGQTRTSSPGHVSATAGPVVATPGAARPLAKRPKGRYFLSTVILSIIAFVVTTIWNQFVAYQAYGTIQGKVLALAPIASGSLVEVCVQEGDHVQEGQLLARLKNYDLERECLQLRSNLAMALSGLRVRKAEFAQWQDTRKLDRVDRQADYFRLLGELHTKRARLIALQSIVNRNQQLIDSDAISPQEAEEAKTNFEGLQNDVQELAQAVERLKASFDDDSQADGDALIAEEQKVLEVVQQQLAQIESLEKAAEIRAPAAGRIVRSHHHCGEYLQPADQVFELLADGSLQAVIYVPQTRAERMTVGRQIGMTISADQPMQPFRIQRIGDRAEVPPLNLSRYYRTHETLIPIYATPVLDQWEAETTRMLRVGIEVGLPRFGSSWRTRTASETNPSTLAHRSSKESE